MKKFVFIVFIILIKVLPVFSLSFDISCNLPFKITENNFEIKPFSIGTGVDFSYGKGVLFYKDKNIAYGISLKNGKLLPEFPMNLKVGKLSISGSLSNINNPLLSSSLSPFGGNVFPLKLLKASLPLDSGYEKPFGLYTDAGYKQKEFETKISAFYFLDGCFGGEGIIKTVFPGKLKVNLSGTVISGELDAKDSDSWFIENPFYRKSRLTSSNFQVQLSFSGWNIIFSDSFYESVKGGVKTVYKAETSFHKGSIYSGLSFFYNPNHNLITPSSKQIDECFQVKMNLMSRKRIGKSFPVFWKTGISAFYDGQLCSKEDTLKLSGGMDFLCWITDVSFTCSGEFGVPLDEFAEEMMALKFRKTSVSLKNTWYFEKIQPALKVSGSYMILGVQEKNCFSETVSLYLNICSNPSVSFNSEITFNQKNGLNSGINVDSGISVKFSNRFIKISGKCSFGFSM
ncbi:MAG: hypothetical protein HUK25_08800 [Treponema sp.]|nr:hypothetical protein [Treponema sp.]